MAVPVYRWILILTLSIFLGSRSAATSITVSAAYSVESGWTEQVTRERLEKARPIFAQSCGIDLQIGAIVPVSIGVLSGDVYLPYVEAFTRLIREANLPAPTIFYLHRVYENGSGGLTAQAFVFGDAKEPGNLYGGEFLLPKDFSSQRLFHGRIVITDNYLTDVSGKVEAHELGHVLLNSVEHSNLPGNLMSRAGLPEALTFTAAQCERMRTYHEREASLKKELSDFYRNTAIQHFGSLEKAIEWYKNMLKELENRPR